MTLLLAALLLLMLPAVRTCAQSVTAERGIETIQDVPYARDSDPSRMLDIYVPEKRGGALPLVILIHGGGWNAGDKKDFAGVCRTFVRRGYAAASLNYRLSSQAVFPAQAIDCKAAVRWLRAHAATYGFDPRRFVVGGHSAGGHLAAFLGVTNGKKQFDRGPNLGISSDVQAVLWFAGVGDFVKRVQTPGYESEAAPGSGQSLLIGGPVLENRDKALAASPITYVGGRSAPFDLFHGGADRLVPVGQAMDMYDALRRHHVYAELHVLPHADHGGPGYFTPTMFNQIDRFLARVLAWTPPALRLRVENTPCRLSPVGAPAMCLEVRGASPDGSPVCLAPVGGAGRHGWRLRAVGDGFYSLRPADDPKAALTVQAAADRDQTPVVVMPDRGTDAQRWMLTRDVVSGTYALTPKCAPESALDDFGGNSTSDAVVDIFSYSGDDSHEQWVLTPPGGQ